MSNMRPGSVTGTSIIGSQIKRHPSNFILVVKGVRCDI